MSTLLQKELPATLLRAENLPSLPAVALEVLRLTQDDGSTIDDLARCLSRDPALTAKLLKLSNSALFGQGKGITTLQRATMVLGTKTVKLMSLSFSLASTLPKSGRAAGFDLVEYWRRSLVRSVAAKVLAETLGSRRGDEAFLCGLLAHLGRLVLARALPEIYEPVVRAAGGWPTLEEEERGLGFTSTDVGAALLRTWRLPEPLVLAVAHGEADGDVGGLSAEVRELAAVLRAARLAEAVLCDERKGPALASLRETLRARAGLADETVDKLLVGLQAGVAETGRMLSLELPSGLDPERLLEEARQQTIQVGLGAALDLEEARRANARLEDETRRLAHQARTDALTGLANRAAFEEFLAAEVARRVRERQPLSLGLVLVDLDHFKAVNDTHGHAVGDEVLRRVARAIRAVTRKEDLAARFGGEEFAVVLPSTNPHGLKAVAERVRQAIAKERIALESAEFAVTASVGAACIAEFTAPEEGLALVRLADQYLYRAKENGRNRCEIHGRVRFPGR